MNNGLIRYAGHHGSFSTHLNQGGHQKPKPLPNSIDPNLSTTMVVTRTGNKHSKETVGSRNISRPVPQRVRGEEVGTCPPGRVSRREIDGMTQPYNKSQYRKNGPTSIVPHGQGSAGKGSSVLKQSNGSITEITNHCQNIVGKATAAMIALGHTENINADPNLSISNSNNTEGAPAANKLPGMYETKTVSGDTRLTTYVIQSSNEENEENRVGEFRDDGENQLNYAQENGNSNFQQSSYEGVTGDDLLIQLANYTDSYDPGHDPVLGTENDDTFTHAHVSVEEESGQEETSAHIAYRGFLQRGGYRDDDDGRASEVRNVTRSLGWKEYKLLNKADLEFDSAFAKLILTELGLYPVKKDLVLIKDNWTRIKRDVKDGMSQARSTATQKIQKSFFGKIT